MIQNITNILPNHPSRRYNKRSLDAIQQIVIHHSGGLHTQTPADIARYHVSEGNHICSEGCPGIAYHYMIDWAGKGFKVNELETISYHVSGHNIQSVGICFIGNYDQMQPAITQLDTCVAIIQEINKKVGRQLPIEGHRAFKATNCPGSYIDTNYIAEMAYGIVV